MAPVLNQNPTCLRNCPAHGETLRKRGGDLFTVRENEDSEVLKRRRQGGGIDPVLRVAKESRTLESQSLTSSASGCKLGVRQLWFADDASGVGKLRDSLEWATQVHKLGPQYGYYLNPHKLVIVVPSRQIDKVRDALADTPFKHARIQDKGTLLGGYVGMNEGQEAFVANKVEQLNGSLSKLLTVGQDHPQELYTAVSASFQHKWNYLQRTHDVVKEVYQPLEESIRSQVLPTIFRWLPNDAERKITALPVRKGGLGLANPVESAVPNFQVAKRATGELIAALKGETKWDPVQHHRTFTAVSSAHKGEKEKKQSSTVSDIKEDTTLQPDTIRAFKRASEFPSGHFLIAKPLTRNGAVLSAHEFRDAADLRYARKPPDLPQKCHACGKDAPQLTLNHALTCKKGGGVVGRHEILAVSLATIAEAAVSAARINKNCCVRRPPENGIQGLPGLYSDVRITGLKQKEPAKTLDIDVRMFYPEATSARVSSIQALLKKNETEKNTKYKSACTSFGTEFEPFVCTTDGVLAEGAERVIKMLGSAIAEKWGKQKGEVMAWIRGRLSLSIARAASACMRGFGRAETKEAVFMKERTVGFYDGAALGRLLRRTGDGGFHS